MNLAHRGSSIRLLLALVLGTAACSDGGGDGETGTGGDGGNAVSGPGGMPSGTTGGGGDDGSGGGKLYPDGPPGCGLAAAAFCDAFDAPSGATSRSGELDPKKWSAARMCNIGGPTNEDEAVAIGLATVTDCRSGLPNRVPTNLDTLICDGNDHIQSSHLLVATAAQNYGQNSYRARQPFDFAGRTGTVVFDADGSNAGLLGWISLEITEHPTPAPSFTFEQNYENGSIPENAIEIQFVHNCGGNNVGVSNIIVYDDFAQASPFSLGTTCVPTEAGKLNHFEVRLSEQRIEVFATPPSTDGLSFGEPVLLGSADIALPFSRGYVHFTTHNHATLKYSNDTVDAWVVRWDNLGFDGPAIVGASREYEALDSLTQTSSGKTNVAYRLADVADGPAQTISIHDVDLQGVTGAKLALQNWNLHFAGSEPPADYALNYRLNGHAWKVRTLTASELQMMADLPNAGTRSLLLDVDVADLIAGTNLLQFTTTNANMGYPPVVLNIDLIVETP